MKKCKIMLYWTRQTVADKFEKIMKFMDDMLINEIDEKLYIIKVVYTYNVIKNI